MADEDPFASIIGDCHYSSSQEGLLVDTKFAREDEAFAEDGDAGNFPPEGNSDGSLRQLNVPDDARERCGGEFTTVDVDCTDTRDLGFRGESKRECSPKRSSIESPSKKSRVSGLKSKVSPLVHCTGKMVIESEADGKELVVFRGDVSVKIVSPLRCVTPDGIECTEKLGSECGGDDRLDEIMGKNVARKKLEFGGDTEEMEVEEEEGNGMKNGETSTLNKEDGDHGDNNNNNSNPLVQGGRGVCSLTPSTTASDCFQDGDHGDGSKKQEDDRNEGGGMSTREDNMERQGKRELPRSMYGLVWGEGGGYGEFGNGSKEGDLKEASVAENGGGKSMDVEAHGDGKSKDGEGTMRCILEVLRVLVSETRHDDGGEVDIFETAKSRGMTFPQSRFRLQTEEDA